jgi:MFS transporter, AAHS family, 4-hydroxybenzoate transporter
LRSHLSEEESLFAVYIRFVIPSERSDEGSLFVLLPLCTCHLTLGHPELTRPAQSVTFFAAARGGIIPITATNATVDVAELLDAHPVGSFQIRVLILCALAVALDGFNTQAIGYVAPAIARDWHLGREALSPVFASGLIGLMIGALSFGPLADRFGRKRIIIACTAFFGVLSLASVAAHTLNQLIALRFIGGLGLGGVMPNSIALTSEFSPHRSRGRMVMIMFCGFPIGATIGGFAAASIIPRYGWQGVFIAGGILPLLLVPALVAMLPESIRHLVLQGDKPAQVRALLAKISRDFVFSPGAEFVIREERAPGLAVGHLFRQGRALPTLLLWIVFFASLLDLFLLANWLPTVFHDAGISMSLSVIATALFQGGGVAGTLALGWLVDRFGVYRMLTAIYFLGAIFIAFLGHLHAIGAIMLCTFGAGVGIIGGQTGANVVAALVYPTYIRSTGVGWALGIGRMGSVVCPLVGGMMLAQRWPLPTIFLAAAVPAVCGAAAIYLVGRTPQGTAGGAVISLAPTSAE